MYPQPGGDYTYILDSLGPFIGFVRLWAECLIVRPCTITIVALTFAKYSIYNIPHTCLHIDHIVRYSVKLIFPECEPPDDSVRMLAAVCICTLSHYVVLMSYFYLHISHDQACSPLSTAGTCAGPRRCR